MPTYNATYDFAIDRFNAIFHTRLNLDTCALNYYLKIGCRESPVRFCGLHNATVKYFFLNVHFILPLELIFFPLFFLSIFADRWSSMSKAQIISVFLFGSLLLSEQILIHFLTSSLLYPDQRDFIK